MNVTPFLGGLQQLLQDKSVEGLVFLCLSKGKECMFSKDASVSCLYNRWLVKSKDAAHSDQASFPEPVRNEHQGMSIQAVISD